ncbi:DivIVA domain-containing protein [Actinoplanes sp. RD1]|uniref:DivIVA domain-containing protein n=1 Tax=Actinoplanes sp. RD1 TaxID=3064538 RepID=UPI0027409A46|nr:DivIVA domain-containing protein [Actinoplanes sp. RD1]
MPPTPAEIQHTEFAKASLGRRGYDEEQVDTLLDEATLEMIRLLEENEALRRRLGAGPGDAGRAAEVSAAAAEFGRARQACERAEQEAVSARRRLDEARRSAAAAGPGPGDARVLARARQAADDHVRAAQEQSRALLAEARERAGRTRRDARTAADALGRRSSVRGDADVADLAGVARDIDELTRFAVDYRAALAHRVNRHGRLI